MDWDAVRTAVRDDDYGKNDLTVDVRDLAYLPNDSHGAFSLRGGVMVHPLTQWAEVQVCNRLGIPVRYFRRCSEGLRKAQIDYWISRLLGDTRWLVRMHGENIRAVLSSAYESFDNHHVIEFWEQTGLAWEYDYQIWITEGAFHLRCIRGEGDIQAGVHISNSEVGKRAVAVDALVYRRVCFNGMVILLGERSIFYKKHIWIQPAELYEKFSQAVMDATEAASHWSEVLERSRGFGVSETKLNELLEQRNYSEEYSQQIKEAYQDDGSESVFSVVNAITEVAQTLEDTDRRYEEEVFAGKYLQIMAA